MKILVLGASGMLGNAMLRVLSENEDWDVVGTVRSGSTLPFFAKKISRKIIYGVDVENQESLLKLFVSTRPDVVINCVGLIKQLESCNDPLLAISINSILPHRLSRLCQLSNSRLILFSTDCVFSGKTGKYTEDNPPDSNEIYGQTKYLGEINNDAAVTIRTSIIGHEIQSSNGLLEWFLSQNNECKGYTDAFFSGLPTVELSRVVRDIIIPQVNIKGLYHISSGPISKYELLRLVANQYEKNIRIIPDNALKIDRSLISDKFKSITGYTAPSWAELVKLMHSNK